MKNIISHILEKLSLLLLWFLYTINNDDTH